MDDMMAHPAGHNGNTRDTGQIFFLADDQSRSPAGPADDHAQHRKPQPSHVDRLRHTRGVLAAYRAAGIRLAVDGAGFSLTLTATRPLTFGIYTPR